MGRDFEVTTTFRAGSFTLAFLVHSFCFKAQTISTKSKTSFDRLVTPRLPCAATEVCVSHKSFLLRRPNSEGIDTGASALLVLLFFSCHNARGRGESAEIARV